MFDGSRGVGRGGTFISRWSGSGKVIIKTFREWSPAAEMDGDGDVSRPAGADVYDIPRLPGDDVTLRANGNSDATSPRFKHSRSVFQEDRCDIYFFGLPGVLLLRVVNVTEHVIIISPPP